MGDTAPDVRKWLQQIEAGAENVRQAATELSNRVIAFERWLNGLPGKVATRCSDEFTDPDGEVFFVSFARDGKDWSLYYGWHEDATGEATVRELLRDASVEIKARAVERFPNLLQEMVMAQRGLVARITTVTKGYDQFAAAAGIKGGA